MWDLIGKEFNQPFSCKTTEILNDYDCMSLIRTCIISVDNQFLSNGIVYWTFKDTYFVIPLNDEVIKDFCDNKVACLDLFTKSENVYVIEEYDLDKIEKVYYEKVNNIPDEFLPCANVTLFP